MSVNENNNVDIEQAEADEILVPPAPRRRVSVWLMTGFFAIFFAFAVFAALGNLIGVTQIAGELEASIPFSGWLLLILGIALPVVVFVLAVWLGRKRSLTLRALILLAGLGLVAVAMLDIQQSIRLGSFFV